MPVSTVPPIPVIELAGTRLGGPLGMTPTLMIGGLFFQGDRLVANPATGTFAKATAARVIHQFLDLCTRTGIQAALAIQGQTVPALIRYLDWIINLDFFTGPIIVDAPHGRILNPAIAHARDIGILDRVVYDSLHPASAPEDLQALRDYHVRHCILLASNSQNLWPAGRLAVLQGPDGLVARARNAGVETLLIDTASLGAAEMALPNLAIPLVKAQFPWPVGQGTSNAVEYLRKIQAPHLASDATLRHAFTGLLGLEPLRGALTGDATASPLYTTLDVTYAVAARLAGADYLLTAIESAISLTPALAATDAMLGYQFTRLQKGQLPNKATHPLYRLMI